MASSGMTRRRYFVLGSASVGVLGEPLSMTPCPPSNSRITDFGLILRISATSDVVRNLGNARGSRRIGGSTRGARLCRRRACSCDAASTTEQSRIPPLTAPALTRHTWYTRLLITLQRFKVVLSGTPNLFRSLRETATFGAGTKRHNSVANFLNWFTQLRVFSGIRSCFCRHKKAHATQPDQAAATAGARNRRMTLL